MRARTWRTMTAVAAGAAFWLGAPAGARAAEEDLRGVVEEQARRIEELERRLGDLEGRPGASSSDLDAAIRRYLEEKEADGGGEDYPVGLVRRPANDRFRFGGYTSVLYRSPDEPGENPSFEGSRVVPQFSFEVSPGIDFSTEIEFEHGGSGASFLDDAEVLVEYAEVRFHVDEAFVPKAGILLIPFLRYNLYHDDPIWNLQDRPFTATRVFKAAFQQPGVGAEGVLPFGEGHSFNYNVALTNGVMDGVSNEKFSSARTPFLEDNNHDKAVWGRVGAAPRLPWVDAADLGASFARGRLDDGGRVTMTGYGFDGKLTKGRFDLIFEWTRFHYDRPDFQDVTVMPTGATGGFVQVDARILEGLPPSENGIVGEASTLTLVARYEWCDLNTRVTGASMADDARAVTLGLAFRPTPKTVIRLERKEERSSFDDPHADELGQWVVSLSTYF